MFKIQTVEIDGFWNSLNLRAELCDGVNIFIGRNGTGKTTFINILEAALTADLYLLESLQFSQIRLFLKNKRKSRNIVITKTPLMPYDRLTVKIGKRTFELALIPKEPDYRRHIHPKYADELNSLKESLNELVNISWLSIQRELLGDEYRESFQHRPSSINNPIDQRISDLTRRFTSYQVQLQSMINNISNKFRNDVLTNILYSEAFDTSPKASALEIDLAVVNNGLRKTYLDLGLLDPVLSKRIEEHINAIQKSINTIIARKRKRGKRLTINDVLPLSLLSRTQHIVESSTAAEMQKSTILKPVNDYLNILGNYIKDKNFILDPSFSGDIIVRKGDKVLSFEQLSSGEKQLFILLTESLLQRNQPYIFIADEPELSLHIEWQRRVLSDIKSLNTEAQIIVATHSPEIAGRWRNNIINMKDIIHE